MNVHRDPYGHYADRINRVLDHVFEVFPNLSSYERNKIHLEVLAEEFDKMTQRRRARLPQLSISDNGSSSPNDPSGMVKTPEDRQAWNQWQPDAMYRHGYAQDLPPVSGDVWWPIPVQQGVIYNPTVPQHDDYGYGIGVSHV